MIDMYRIILARIEVLRQAQVLFKQNGLKNRSGDISNDLVSPLERQTSLLE